MSVSIVWTDSAGAASLTNGLPDPGWRLGDWTPRDASIGPTAIQLSTGRIYGAKFRRDGLVSFEMRNVPGANMPLMLRLKLHMMKGGTIDLTADNELAERWAVDAILAPGTVPSILFADDVMLEYTFSVVLREAAPAPTSGGGSGCGGGCVPIGLSASSVIPQGRKFRHKDALYYHDFGQTYASEAAWRASFRPGYLDPVGGSPFYYNEEMPAVVTLSSTRKFNCRSTMRIPSAVSGVSPGYMELFVGKWEAPRYSRAWTRTFVWFDPSTATGQASLFEALITMRANTSSAIDTGYALNVDYGGGGVQAEKWVNYNASGYISSTTYTADSFSALSGRWVCMVALLEDDGYTATRARQWRDGVLMSDVTGIVPYVYDPPQGTIDEFYTAPSFLCDTVAAGTYAYWVGLYEALDGGTQASPINPYSGLAGI